MTTGGGGAGGAGTVGAGKGGAGTVTAGTGGRGGGVGIGPAAAAVPGSNVKPGTTATQTRTPISEQLVTARNGCALRRIGNNPGGMSVAKRDYYEVLGVPQDANDETIRRAFDEQARRWHPDVADGPDAEARFRELAEAYTVLAKRESRLLYDRYGFRGRGNQGFDEGLSEARPPEPVRGENIHTDLELRSFEAEEGTRRVISFHAIVRCPACMDRDAVGLPDPECGFCHGTGAVETERRLRLRIPPGIEDGAQLRVSGDGNDPGPDSIPGDLLVSVRVLPPPNDPRSVRYIAFALLLVAIAALALYVIR